MCIQLRMNRRSLPFAYRLNAKADASLSIEMGAH